MALAALATPLMGAPLTPSEALTRLSDTPSGEIAMRLKAPALGTATPVYTASADGMSAPAFYVFNNPSGGFTIVSADDRLPVVLGFTESGEFDIDRISPDMKWWLGEYSKDIARMYSADGVDTPAPADMRKRASVVERDPIAPMLTTRWNQMAPYNMMVPRQYPTGCVATAMAQVMKYHEWPDEAHGSQGGVDFEGTFYDWENMIDDYESTGYSITEADAVATLMRQCGASVNMMYSPYASGAYSNAVPIALYTYFGYSEAMTLEFRDYHKMSEWNDMVYAELAADRPVYYSGSSSAGGHAFVCDGYLSNNFFHFNWGWGGYQDGYFLLNALNPGVGGTGSFAGGYNSGQEIVIGIKKSEGETGRQLTLLSTGSFIYDEELQSFGVGSDPDGYNMFYNPLGYIVNGTMGLKVTPMEGGEAKYFRGNDGVSLQSYYGLKNFSCAVSGLANGTYKCEPALYNDGQWYPVQVVMGTQTYVTLTVEGGKTHFANNGIPTEDLPHLLSGLPRTMPTVYGDAAKIFRVTVLNVSGGDYNNELSLSLYEQGKGGAGAVREVSNHVTIPGNSSLDIDFVIDSPNPEGTYDVYLMDYQGNYLISPSADSEETAISDYVVKSVDSGRGITEGSQMTFSAISPNFWTLGGSDGIGLVMTAKNDFYAEKEQSFYVKLFRAEDFKEVHSFGPFSLTLQSKEETVVNFTSREMDLKPGNYYWQVVDTKDNNLSRLYPLMVNSETLEKNGIFYQKTSGNTARIVASSYGEYEGDVKIPSSIDGYKVNDVRVDAFTFASELKRVDFPESIKTIENGSFYGATSLEIFGTSSKTLPALYPDAFAPGAQENIYIDVHPGYGNMFAHAPIWSDFIYSYWTINLGEGVTLDTELMEIDPFTGKIYEPYYVGYDEHLVVSVVENDEMMGFRAIMKIDGEETTEGFYRKIWLPALEGKNGEVTFEAVPGAGVGELAKDEQVSVFRIDGVQVLKDAPKSELKKLPRGLYIVNGRKVSL